MELFLDANAHLPLNPKALKSYTDFISSSAGHGHPSSLSVPGRAAASALEEARSKIAQLIGAESPHQIVFTSSCTQAAEWGMEIFANIGYDKNKSDETRLVSSPIEHPAVKQAVDSISQKLHSIPGKINVSKEGLIYSLTDYDQAFGSHLICIHLQNEIGTIQPIEFLKCWPSNRPYLFSDISQSLGKIPVNVMDLKIDIAIAGAHKFGGPGGVGFIYLKNPEWWKSFGTGSRYFKDRAGTPDVASIVATASALEESINTLSERTQNMVSFQTALENGLTQRGFDIIGKAVRRAPNTTFVNIPNLAAGLVLKLSEKGIHVGLGSACGSMHAGNSPLMTVLGRGGGAHDFMRISQYGEYNSNDAKYFLDILDELL